jgi:hypothetical protein
MIGNLTYQPKSRSKITISEVEEFLLCLLKDISTTAPTVVTLKSKVNYEGDFNLSDLDTADETQALLSFRLNKEDPRNSNLNAAHGDSGDVLKVVYQIMLISKRGKVSSHVFLKAWEEIITAVTDNYNSGVSYEATLSTGPVLTTSVTQNTADDFPSITIMREDQNQINYLTALNNVVFNINKKT